MRKRRVMRGGSFDRDSGGLRTSIRSRGEGRLWVSGFRVVIERKR